MRPTPTPAHNSINGTPAGAQHTPTPPHLQAYQGPDSRAGEEVHAQCFLTGRNRALQTHAHAEEIRSHVCDAVGGLAPPIGAGVGHVAQDVGVGRRLTQLLCLDDVDKL
jgi:hypothetical protein